MPEFFDRQRWRDVIRTADWYATLEPELRALAERAQHSNQETATAIKHAVYGFFERALDEDLVALGMSGPNWDAERRAIDHVVIHHTSQPPGLSIGRLNAMHLLRLYAIHYAHPKTTDRAVRGRPLYSGHFHAGRQVFYAYHWLVRMDGTAERLLADGEIGWQAGDWGVNCRSIAVCLDNDYAAGQPDDVVLTAAAELINEHYPHVSRHCILGHREVNPKTTCPGNWWLTSWRETFLAKITASA